MRDQPLKQRFKPGAERLYFEIAARIGVGVFSVFFDCMQPDFAGFPVDVILAEQRRFFRPSSGPDAEFEKVSEAFESVRQVPKELGDFVFRQPNIGAVAIRQIGLYPGKHVRLEKAQCRGIGQYHPQTFELFFNSTLGAGVAVRGELSGKTKILIGFPAIPRYLVQAGLLEIILQGMDQCHFTGVGALFKPMASAFRQIPFRAKSVQRYNAFRPEVGFLQSGAGQELCKFREPDYTMDVVPFKTMPMARLTVVVWVEFHNFITLE